MTAFKLAGIGAFNIAFAISMGAFAAHGLKEKLDPNLLSIFEKAVKYHLIHALALVVLPILFKNQLSGANVIWYMQLAGILLFSGSLYLLSTRFVLGIDSWNWLGAITPLGGLLFVGSWILLGVKLFRV
jgi:uncharacterized membrane protein YgdD (TMEM256/DUF423 family)